MNLNLKKSLTAILSLVVLLGLIDFFSFSTKEALPDVSNNSEVFYRVKSYEYNHDIHFCGEKVPLHSQDIYERFDYEVIKNSFWHSEMMVLFKRSGKYFPIIEPILKKYNIPSDFKYLMVIESGMDNVVSPAGAAGFWQIMSTTGKEYGLEVSGEIDERYHLEMATEAACQYLVNSYEIFNSWTLVAASYNMGMSGLQRKLNQQNTNNYYDLLLNSETARYVFRILAVKDIFENPKKYGFNISDEVKYQPLKYKKIKVTETILDLGEYAEEQGVNLKIIRICNPWIKSNRLIVAPNKSYVLAIPTERLYTFNHLKVPHQDSTATDTATSEDLVEEAKLDTNSLSE